MSPTSTNRGGFSSSKEFGCEGRGERKKKKTKNKKTFLNPKKEVTDHTQVPQCSFLYPFSALGLLRTDTLQRAHTLKCKSRVSLNSNAKQLPTYLSYNLLCHSHFSSPAESSCTWELNQICSGQLLSRMHRLLARSWLLKRDLRWWGLSCWLISMQPWTALRASGPSSLLTEPCAKDKTFLWCVQCDHAFFPLLSAVSFLYKLNRCTPWCQATVLTGESALNWHRSSPTVAEEKWNRNAFKFYQTSYAVCSTYKKMSRQWFVLQAVILGQLLKDSSAYYNMHIWKIGFDFSWNWYRYYIPSVCHPF